MELMSRRCLHDKNQPIIRARFLSSQAPPPNSTVLLHVDTGLDFIGFFPCADLIAYRFRFGWRFSFFVFIYFWIYTLKRPSLFITCIDCTIPSIHKLHWDLSEMEYSGALQSVTLGQQNCKVVGRLLRLWEAVNVKSKFADPLISIDGVLLDEHGTTAQLSVPKRFQKQFRHLLKEGHVYMITDVAAVDIKNKTHVYHYQNYMLQFKQNTKVDRLETRGAGIPKFSFNYCPFDKLPEMDIMSRPLQDVIGVISHVGPFDYASPTSQTKLRKIKIRNLDEQTQEIRLWGNHGETFDEDAVLKKSQEVAS